MLAVPPLSLMTVPVTLAPSQAGAFCSDTADKNEFNNNNPEANLMELLWMWQGEKIHVCHLFPDTPHLSTFAKMTVKVLDNHSSTSSFCHIDNRYVARFNIYCGQLRSGPFPI